MREQGRNLRVKLISWLIAISLLVTSLFVVDMGAFAAGSSTAVVTATGLNVRAGIGTSYEKVAYLENGDVVTLLDIGYNTDGTAWYKVQTSAGTQGWASGAYLDVTISMDDYDLYLKLSGFPESYHASLKALHEKYPNWIFEAQHTGITWDEMIKAQTKLGMSLTANYRPTAWKSIQTGAYDWTTSEWIQLDSGGWVAASEELVKHYVDPRNFLTEATVFQFLKQSYDASLMTAEEIESVKAGLVNMVQGSFLAGACEETDDEYGTFTTYVDIIMEAAKRSKVSPYVIASMIIQEQGRQGGGNSISGTVSGYEGYYNFLNIKAWEHSGNSAVVNGLIYAKERGWDTKTKSIIECAIYFGEGYINVGQDTMYLKKFDLVGTLYTHQYMTNIQGADSEGKHISKAYQDSNGAYTAEAIATALEFKIPVFGSMPETACPLPADNGSVSPNYMLKGLTVSGQSLTPSFSMYETEYSLIVANEISSVTIGATPYHSGAKINGTGTVALNVGTNNFDIVVTAENGGVRTYKISIIRQENTGGTVVANPVISTSTYTLSNSDKTITGITTFPVSAADFMSAFTVTNGSIKLLKADGSEQTGNVGTGTVLKVYSENGTEKGSYTVVLYGDTNGDGNVNALDLLRVQKHILAMSSLSGVQGSAGDTSKNGTIDALDLLQVQKHIIGVKAIGQSK